MTGALCTCGVTAIGRCDNCGNAFCLTHQGSDDYPKMRFTDRCQRCVDAQKAQGYARLDAQRRAEAAGTGQATTEIHKFLERSAQMNFRNARTKFYVPVRGGLFGDRNKPSLVGRGWCAGKITDQVYRGMSDTPEPETSMLGLFTDGTIRRIRGPVKDGFYVEETLLHNYDPRLVWSDLRTQE